MAGGKGGFGRPSLAYDEQEAEISLVEHMVKAASGTGRGEITRGELFAYLASEYDADYAKQEGESGPQHGSRVGKLFKEALAEVGVSIDAVKVKSPEGTESRGYRLQDLQVLS